MCNPIIGAVISAAGSIASAASQAGVAKAQARIARNNAVAERDRAATDAARERQQQRARISARRARTLAGGIDLEGSPLEVVLGEIGESELKIADNTYERELRARNHEAEASIYKSRAKSTILGGALGAISPFVDELRRR
jgi:hypothetical protein